MCFGGNTQQTNTYSTPPPYIQEAQKNLINMGQQLVGQPQQIYGGQTVAGFTPAQNQAFQSINSAQGMAMPYYNSAAQYFGNATAPLGANVPGVNAQTIGSFESPYMNDVMRSTMANINEGNAEQQQSLAGDAISKGAWGGDRSGVAQGELARQQGLASGQVYAGLENQNYAQALAAAQQQQGVGLNTAEQQAALNMQGGQNMANLGTGVTNNALSSAEAQLQAGNQQQQNAQNQLTSQYQQFQQAQMFPYQQMQFLSGLINPTASTAGGSQQTSSPAPSALSQIGGLAMAAAPFLVADGGRVPGRAFGGGMPMSHHGHHASMPHPHMTVMPSASGPRGMGMPHMGLTMPHAFSGSGLAAGGAAPAQTSAPDPIYGPMTSIDGAGGVAIPQITSGGGANEPLSTAPVSNFTPTPPSQWQSSPSPFGTPKVDWTNFYKAMNASDAPPKSGGSSDGWLAGLAGLAGLALLPVGLRNGGSIARDDGGSLDGSDPFSLADDTLPPPLSFTMDNGQMPSTGPVQGPMPTTQTGIPMNAAALAAQAQAGQTPGAMPPPGAPQGMSPGIAPPQAAAPPVDPNSFAGKMQANLGPGWKQAMMSAGAGMMAGTSPNAMVNIGQGLQQGLAAASQQKQIAAQQEYMKAMGEYRMEMADARQRSVDEMAQKLSQQADKTAADEADKAKREQDWQTHESAWEHHEDAIAATGAGGTWSFIGTDPATNKPILMNSRTGQQKLGDAPIGAKPSSSAPGIAPDSTPPWLQYGGTQ